MAWYTITNTMVGYDGMVRVAFCWQYNDRVKRNGMACYYQYNGGVRWDGL